MTVTIERILFATDFSDPARRAQDYATTLATRFGAKIIALHVAIEDVFVPAPELAVSWLQENVEKSKKRLAAEMSAITGAQLEVCQGNAVQEILRVAREHDVHLIVVGTHGRTGLSHVLLGSVAEKIVRLATCPVLTVHPLNHPFTMESHPKRAAKADAGDSQTMTCVYRAANPSQAELIRNLLESQGIRAATGDTHNPFPGLSIAPAEVFVERRNEAAARGIIAEATANRSDDPADE